MALTKVTGHVVKPDTNIQFHNTKSTGIVTFAHTSNATSSTTGALQVTGGVGIVKDLHVGGNITVGGTLTYDDVTNIDSLGIITARGGIHVGPITAGVATVYTNGNASFTGIVTATTFVGGLPITNGADNRIVTCTSASAIAGESSFTYNAGVLIASNASGNVTQQLNATGGDAKIVLDNSGDGNYSGIDFERERSGGQTGYPGGSIFLKSDTSSNNAIMYLQTQSASAQSPVTTALTDNNGVRLKLQGGLGIFSVECGSTEKFRISPAGEVLIGESSARSYVDGAGYTQTPKLQVEADNNTSSAISLTYNSAGGAAVRRASFMFARTADGTAVADNSVLGEVLFMGEGNSTQEKAASIRAEVDGTPGANDMPGRLGLWTSLDGTASPVERLRIDQTGRVIIGDSMSSVSSQSNLQVRQDGSGANLELVRSYNSASTPARLRFANSRGTAGSPLIVADDDTIGEIRFHAYDGTDYAPIAASIFAVVDGTPGSNDMPGRLEFHTTPDGNQTTVERMRIDASGQVNIGAASPTASENGQLNVYITTSSGKAQIVHSAGTGGLRLAGTGGGSGSNLVFSNNYTSGTFSDHWTITHNGGDDSLRIIEGGLSLIHI